MEVSRVRYWWCAKCQGVFKKEDLENRIHLYSGSGQVLITGTRECNHCHTIYSVKDIYTGMHDLPRNHWPEFIRATGEDMELACLPFHSPDVPSGSTTKESTNARTEPGAPQSTGATLRCRCPKCKATFEVAAEYAGGAGTCPTCKTRFRIPSAQSVITKPSTIAYHERDNNGTRQDTHTAAVMYWMNERPQSPRKDPFVLYDFDSEKEARAALLELPCIHVAVDSGKLICTKTLIFGYYQCDAKYQVILCGDDLDLELWNMAKDSFIRHRGQRWTEQSPGPCPNRTEVTTTQTPRMQDVQFLRKETRVIKGHTMTYVIHSAPDSVIAQAFLRQHPVSINFHYIVVETPQGNYCRDIDGIYKEQ